MILAKRYGFLGFQGKSVGRFPRLRVAVAAVLTLPGGRFIQAARYIRRNALDGTRGIFYALFDVFCGLSALPTILFGTVPPRRNYLAKGPASFSKEGKAEPLGIVSQGLG